jgi:hypothetical protein
MQIKTDKKNFFEKNDLKAKGGLMWQSCETLMNCPIEENKSYRLT